MSTKEKLSFRILENHPADSRVKISEDNVFQTLSCRMGTGGGNVPMIMEENDMEKVARRLTPLECERLQGYPDNWTFIGMWRDTNGKLHKHADSPRYKALGNSIALPFWEWMANRMVEVLREDGEENPTMASLFDGIGGFPLVYSRCGCKPVWASEIEEFPMAVTKIRFPESEEQKKEIGKINKLHDMPDFTERSAGTHTDYYEIPKEEYDRITAIDNYKIKLNSEYQKSMPDWIRWGYGFYGVNVCEHDGKYYYTVCTGNSCE